MFTDMQKWAEIRRRVLNDEISKRAACREYEIHWDTLEKILAYSEPPGYRLTEPRRSKVDPFLPVIQEILESDKKVHRKQRHTTQRIFERLRDEHGYDGGLTIVSSAVRKLKQQNKEVFFPLSHPPGEGQVDYGFADVWLNGELTKVALFVMTLPYSDAIFIQAFPRECTESFLEGHVRAFEFYGGVPTRISYDNSKVAVGKIVGHREREVTKEFLRLKSHFLYEDHFCLVRRPNEKGHVERLLDFARRSFLVPVPRVESLEELNAQLLHCCEKDLDRTLRGKSAAKRELLNEEQLCFLSIPTERFEARRLQTVHSNSLSLIRFDRNSYSVPTEYAHRSLTVIATVDEVRILCGDQLVAFHSRCWEKEQYFFDPIHYLGLLERKPGGFDHARPFEEWELPVCFGILRRRLETEQQGLGTKEFIKVLRLLERHSLSSLKSAVQHALEIGASSADAIRLILEYQQEPVIDLFCLDGRPHLKQVKVTQTNVSAYQSLLTSNPGGCSVS
ncbi:Integrase core domain protein [Thalassoglobus neptunius]|uniref:Integrase core domain protein n=1 Tax=Thalassoglobus neptunius TaxID=1938619 RepID=A0A5C5X4T6_9PLAN|nr:IS21 family transposase [Thalassoglobus neptunius]TWT57910.1 Integrase core domain protein [Thalassoglobus neptunius]